MLRYTVKRILLAIPTFLGITVVTFAMTRLAPGRVFFGSDFPLTSQRRMLRRVRKAGLDECDLAALLGDNAVRAGLT